MYYAVKLYQKDKDKTTYFLCKNKERLSKSAIKTIRNNFSKKDDGLLRFVLATCEILIVKEEDLNKFKDVEIIFEENA